MDKTEDERECEARAWGNTLTASFLLAARGNLEHLGTCEKCKEAAGPDAPRVLEKLIVTLELTLFEET